MASWGRGQFDVLGQLPALRRYALSLTRNPSEAEDLVQEALLRALERRASYRAGGNLRGWLLAVMHNLFVDRLRSRSSAADHESEFGSRVALTLPANQYDTLRLSQVRRAFDLLPVEQREALHLVTIEGLSYDEASEVLGVPAGTVMSRISRGREALRRWESGPTLSLVKENE
ncbi:sigma-70 family RNA polymerase sigma factor [Devosia sp. FJ2-5-3]|uniref:sigma-70 family RNA polymerase sigma factor n=1 Tax=Devosia sp. FJ2-5-3 TaxID=2976680 RepID=UPI0023D892AD|nr:sigma-70 family RNA polymerase sigma factor [Devosia sp. FJ2-5-3]WEJ57396.1 sigma-70 family RNA polymerase sigma factor [Devosia sp. FJ2-5-3]